MGSARSVGSGPASVVVRCATACCSVREVTCELTPERACSCARVMCCRRCRHRLEAATLVAGQASADLVLRHLRRPCQLGAGRRPHSGRGPYAARDAAHCSPRSRQISVAASTKGGSASSGLRSGCHAIPSRRGGGSGRMGMTATFGSFSSDREQRQDGVGQPRADEAVDGRVVVGTEDVGRRDGRLAEGVVDDLPATGVPGADHWQVGDVGDADHPLSGLGGSRGRHEHHRVIEQLADLEWPRLVLGRYR